MGRKESNQTNFEPVTYILYSSLFQHICDYFLIHHISMFRVFLKPVNFRTFLRLTCFSGETFFSYSHSSGGLYLGQIKKYKCVWGNRSENFRVGTHIFSIFFFWKNMILCVLKGISPFKMHKNHLFSRKPDHNLGFTSKFRYMQGRVTLNTDFFLFWPYVLKRAVVYI